MNGCVCQAVGTIPGGGIFAGGGGLGANPSNQAGCRDADRSDRLRYIEMLDSVMSGLWLCSTALDCSDFSGARCSRMCSVSVCSHSRLLCRINSNEKQGSSRLA